MILFPMLCVVFIVKAIRKEIKSNLEITPNKIKGRNVNNKSGYIRADDLFYFKKDKIDYKVIGRLSDDMLDKLIKLVISLNVEHKTKDLINNL